jgi:hypothetical protein
MSREERLGRKTSLIVTVSVLAAVAGGNVASGFTLRDGGIMDGCKGTGVPVVVPHEVPVIGVENSGLADITQETGDTGLFVYDRTEGSDWFYLMVGESQAGTCTNAALEEVGYMLCAAQEPVTVWQEWAADVEARAQEIQTYGEPILPCSSAD